jgi:hypothetical protein
MMPDFPHNIRVRFVRLNFFLLHPDVAPSLPCWLSQLNCDIQQGRDRATSGRNKKNVIRPILFLYYEESLVLSNLNSKQLMFHGAHPIIHTFIWSLHFFTVTRHRYEMSEALSLSGTGHNSINPVTSHCYSKFCITRYLYILILHTYKYHRVNQN